MLFEDWARAVAEIEEIATKRTDIIHRLAGLFSKATHAEIGKLVYLCQGQLRSAPTVEESSQVNAFVPPRQTFSPTLDYVYRQLVAMSGAKQDAQAQEQGDLLAHLDNLSVTYVERLLRKRSKPFVSDICIIEALMQGKATDVRQAFDHAFNTIADLGLVASLLWEKGGPYLATVQPRVGVPVHPESQTRRGPEALAEIWGKFGPCFVHTKYDGYRCQIHKDGEKVGLFIGRYLNDWTGRFPRMIQAISQAVRQQVDATSAILDSEIVPFDPSSGRLLPRKLFFKAPGHKAIVFDLLCLNGKDWRSHPYAERHPMKLHVVRANEWPALIRYSNDVYATSATQLQELFLACKENEEEGIIMIHPSSPYRSSYRGVRSKDRLKIKAVDPIDAVIVGFNSSSGAKDAPVETFLVAVFDHQRDEFVTIGKVISGLRREERRRLHERCLDLEVSDPPLRVISKIEPHHWVEPALVVELEVDYIYPSDGHTCGLASEGIGYGGQHIKFMSGEPREDKKPEQITTAEEFLRIRREPGMGQGDSGLFVSTLTEAKQLPLF